MARFAVSCKQKGTSNKTQEKNINQQNMNEETQKQEASKVSPAGGDLEGATTPSLPIAIGMERVGVRDQIVYDDFAKLDLKVGTILSAEKVEKADKLLKL